MNAKMFFFQRFFYICPKFWFYQKDIILDWIYVQGCHRKPGKIRKIAIGYRKKSGKCKKIWNFEICSQFPETAPIPIIVIINPIIVKIVKLYMTFTVKYVQNLCILNDFNKIIKILFNSVIFICSLFFITTAFFFSNYNNLFFTVVWICTQNCTMLSVVFNNID